MAASVLPKHDDRGHHQDLLRLLDQDLRIKQHTRQTQRTELQKRRAEAETLRRPGD